jgi:hypothetical protein
MGYRGVTVNIIFLILLFSLSLGTHAGERDGSTQDDSASYTSNQEKKPADTLTEIDLISDINGQFEHTLNKFQSAENKPKIKTAHKRPTQLFINDSVTIQATNENEDYQTKNTSNTLHAANEIAAIQPTDEGCVKEKVYSLIVDNGAQYERLEDFPFTYECVIRR